MVKFDSNLDQTSCYTAYQKNTRTVHVFGYRLEKKYIYTYHRLTFYLERQTRLGIPGRREKKVLLFLSKLVSQVESNLHGQ